jgi:glycosyltransferase involved in cell wall biosynthesis
MSRPKLLMACANYWHSPFQVGSHHLARGFVGAGWDVAFVSDPISPFHLLQGLTPELKERFASYRRGGVTDLQGRLWAYVPATLLSAHNKPLLRTEWVHRHWASLSLPNVVDVVRARGFADVDLLYFDTTSQNFWLERVTHRRSVFRLADRNVGFSKFTPAMHRLEQELARSVNAVVYAAESLRPHVGELGARKSFHLPNGVDFAHFARHPISKPADLTLLPQPIAIYVGAMHDWFDYALIDAAVARLPQVSFVLIGPEHLARTRLRPAPNLHLLGRRPYAELPAYLQHADVGLIPFDVAGHAELVHSVNPLKLHEYLAAGLPVVATEWEELVALGSPARLSRTPEEFIQGIESAVTGPVDRKALQDYARKSEWRNRVTDLTRYLGF